MKLGSLPRSDLKLLAVTLGGVGLLALIIWLVMPPTATGSELRQPSTFFNQPYGTKAAYLILEELGYGVRRHRRPIDADTLGGVDALVILRPVIDLEGFEEQALRRWVAGGGHLLVAPDVASPDHQWRPPDTLGHWFRYADEPDGSQPAAHRPPGIDRVPTVPSRRFDAGTPLRWPAEDVAAEVLWADDQGVLAVEASYGRGRIIGLADIHALTNEGLREGDAPLWLDYLARRLTKGDPQARLAIDEYHAGFPHQPHFLGSAVHLLWHERWTWAVSQGLLVAVLALLAAGTRLGKPDLQPPRRRRSQGEYTQAAGRLMQAARASGIVSATLYGHVHPRLCRALHLSTRATAADVAAALHERGRGDWAGLVMRAADAQQYFGDAQLIGAAQQLHKMVETLEHGTGTKR